MEGIALKTIPVQLQPLNLQHQKWLGKEAFSSAVQSIGLWAFGHATSYSSTIQAIGARKQMPDAPDPLRVETAIRRLRELQPEES